MKKAPDRAQGHRARNALVLVGTVAEAHPAPADLVPAVQSSWEEFWRSDFARVVSWERDHRALYRLFELYSLRVRIQEAAADVFLEGSQGQMILNPAIRHLTTLGTEISHLEQQFGLTPRSAAGLGLTLGGLRKTMDERNREANERARKKA